MRRLLISGYYGFGNAGDEAILASMIPALKQALPGTRITVISSNPPATQRDHDVDVVPRLGLPSLLNEISRTDVLLSGGGSLLQDVTSVRSLVYYLSIMALASTLGKKVMLFAQGFGPVTSRQGRLMTRRVLNRVDVATFRDAKSLEEVRDLGVRRPHMELTADPVFLLERFITEAQRTSAVAAARQALRDCGLPATGGPLIGVSLRPWKNAAPSFSPEIEAALGRLAASGARVLMLPLHLGEDIGFCEAIATRLGAGVYTLKQRLQPRTMLELVGCLDALVGMRLHSLIFAVSKGVPCAALPYDPKVSGFVETIGLPVASTVTSPDGDQAYRVVEDILANRAGYVASILERRVEQQLLAQRNIELAAQLIQRH